MKIVSNHGSLAGAKTQALLLPLFKDLVSLKGEAKELDKCLGGALSEIIRNKDFTGAKDQLAVAYGRKGVSAKRVVLWGLGDKKKYNTESLRQAAYAVGNALAKQGLNDFAIAADGLCTTLRVDQVSRSFGEGALYSSYEYKAQSKTKKKTKKVSKVSLLFAKAGDQRLAARMAKVSMAVMAGVSTSRDLQNDPANVATATKMAAVAKKIAKHPSLKCKILEKKQLQALGMGGILGVNKGSQQPPKFIIIEYTPKAKKACPTVVLVGKGLTFDSGGISIKGSNGMEAMKFDMCGGSNVIGAMQSIAALEAPVRVVALVPSTDNMPSHSAYCPSDVLHIYGGKTVEIISTDAEGRLILADALAYASKYKPDAVVDMATLTGACVSALGEDTTGLWSNNPKLTKQLLAASKQSDEQIWEMPLTGEYLPRFKSDVADLRNGGSGGGGASQAATFLQEFTGDYAWAHLDIAGPSIGKARRYFNTKGSAIPVRTIVEFIMNYKKVK